MTTTETPRDGYCIEDLAVGMSASSSRTIGEAEIVLFAGISGDVNPIHLSETYAQGSVFKGRVAHGMLTAGLISGLLGARFPGPGAIYLGQTLAFKAPVRIGDTVTVTATVTDINAERRRVTLKTVCAVGETVVIDGEATLLVPRRG